ncbi:MAG: hypothetical protein JRI23_22630 [Deltaproteobacteria bacterium]|jgi:hypothetical protein|nr:hypothetical protein [Deltaproteobacteria bacterium]MBW2534764.1 hypothetical protein [Deltaproteobacteria bacterium]
MSARLRLLHGAAGLVALIISSAGCRAEIDGYWKGRVGTDEACLSLEQTGASLTGEVCVNGDCDEIAHGKVVEEEVTLHYGCTGCAFVAPTRLDLAVIDDTLQGYAHLEECDCTVDACDCVLEAEFSAASTCP